MSSVFYIMRDRYLSFPGEHDTKNGDRQTELQAEDVGHILAVP